MTLAQLLAQARIAIQDPTPGTRWPDSELTQWANEASDEFLLRTGLLEGSAVLAATVDAPADSTYALPADLLKLKRITYRGEALCERAVEFFDWRDWDTETGEPVSFYWADATKIRIFPYSAVTPIAYYVRRAEALVDDADVPELPAVYHPALVHGICARAYAKNGNSTADPEKAAFHEGQFQKGVMLALAHRPTPPVTVPYRHL